MLEILMGGSKPSPKSQLNLVDIEVLSVAQPNIMFNVLDIEVLTTATGA